jgi:hypothetical protein
MDATAAVLAGHSEVDTQLQISTAGNTRQRFAAVSASDISGAQKRMDLTNLLDLPILPVRIATRILSPMQLPANSGSSLRGAFGASLKGLVCVYPQLPRCAPCPMLQACAYPYLFETQAPAGQIGTAGFEDLPRPYVIRSSLGERHARPGDTLTWCVTLIGRAIPHLSYFVLAWQEMGRIGLGRERGRFELRHVEALDLNGDSSETLYDRESNRLHPPSRVIQGDQLTSWLSAPGERRLAALRSLEVRFLTPTLLKHGGQPVSEPQFHLLWRSLQRRLSVLRLAHGAGRPEVDFEESIRLAEDIRLTHWSGQDLEWLRFSRRQGRRVPMGGFVGVARYAGDLAPFLSALKLGSLVGVGHNCTFGQGHYEISLPLVSP